MILIKVAAHWLFSFYIRTKLIIKNYTLLHKNHSKFSQTPSFSPNYLSQFSIQDRNSQTIVVSDFYGTLLNTKSCHLFPFFMLVAFEAGSIIRAFLLLLLSPLLWLFGFQSGISLKLMIFVAFCGLKVEKMELFSKAVMSKFYLENLNYEVCEILERMKKRVVVSCALPRVMVEGFLKEYLEITEVIGVELQIVKGRYYNGFGIGPGCAVEFKNKVLKGVFGEGKADVGLFSYFSSPDNIFISYCKEAYMMTNTENKQTPKKQQNYPKPLIFHDSRLSFLPTPLSTLSLLIFLPISLPLSILRILLGLLTPYKLSFLLGAALGVRFRLHNHLKNSPIKKHTLYACTHRTLLDPVMLSFALQRPVPAVTYSLSPLVESIAPMRTVRLTRNRESDSGIMSGLLSRGDLTICPEGTTCREKYLLRFSPLFAELAEVIVPVAMDVETGWFYGSTAGGLKCLDPVFFFMNPVPGYRVVVLDRVRGGCRGSGLEVANRVQRLLGEALGFECTGLTRKDKYLLLAGNEGFVRKGR